MYIQNSKELAEALRPIATDRVLVRYAVKGRGMASYIAELAVLSTVGGEHFLYHAQIVFVVTRGAVATDTAFKTTALRHEPDTLEKLARHWLGRSADDWCHGEQFMGAYEIDRDGQLYTSIKLEPSDPRWHLLVGVILSELGAQKGRVNPENVVDTHNIGLMSRRFSAFAAENISVWVDQNLSAH